MGSWDSFPFISCGGKGYWNRLCSEDIPDLLREAFDLATWMHQSGKTTWVSKVKELFDKAGMLFVFTNQGCGQEIIANLTS